MLVGVTFSEPLAARLPDQPPLAVQLVAKAVDQVSVLVCPAAIVSGLAVRVMVGAPATATVAAALSLPPVPEQVRLYVVLPVGETLCVPLVLLAPVHPPLAVQLVALVVDQVRVLLWPVAMVSGLAVSVTVGAGTTVTVTDFPALPPEPVQVRV